MIGPIVFKEKPIAKRKAPDDPQLFNRISQQYYTNKRAAQKNDVVSAESVTLYKVVDGKRVIEQPAAAPARNENNALLPSKPRNPAVAITIPKSTANLAAASSKQHSKPPGFIPLTCPFFAVGDTCPSLSSCFFQHSHLDPPRNATYQLFQQAQQESVYPDRNQYKFGFFKGEAAVTCMHWPNCIRSDTDCWHAHWLTSPTPVVSPEYRHPKRAIICRFWASESRTGRPCFRGELCTFLHERREGCEVAPPPFASKKPTSPDKQISHIRRASNSTKNMPLSTTNRMRELSLADEAMPMNLDMDYEVAPVQQAAALPETTATSRRVDHQLKLDVQGNIFDVTITLSSDADEHLRQKEPLSLKVGVLAEHVQDFFNLPKPLFFGPVRGIGRTEHFDSLVDNLRLNLQGAAASLPRVDLLFVQSGLPEWSFLPSTDSKARLSCYVYKKGLWPETDGQSTAKKVDGDRDPQFFDVLDSRIPGGHKILYEWVNKTLPPNVFLADTGDDWNGDKEVWTRFFREAGSTVYHDYDAFKAETKGGVFVLPPKLDLSVMRITADVRDLLWRSYNFFYLGFDDRGSFACEKLFPRGSTILLTHGVYKNHPQSAIAIMKDLLCRVKYADNGNRKVTWKLAAPPNLRARLSILYQTHGDENEYVLPPR
jgi:hypothetical protein